MSSLMADPSVKQPMDAYMITSVLSHTFVPLFQPLFGNQPFRFGDAVSRLYVTELARFASC